MTFSFPVFTAEEMEACGSHDYSPETCPICADDLAIEQAALAAEGRYC